MKILAVCEGGNTRSVHLTFLLKEYYRHHDSLACGIRKNSPETLEMLFKWADKIIVMTEWLKEHIPGEYWDKVLVFEVGDDVWGTPTHPVLIDKIKPFIEEHLV